MGNFMKDVMVGFAKVLPYVLTGTAIAIVVIFSITNHELFSLMMRQTAINAAIILGGLVIAFLMGVVFAVVRRAISKEDNCDDS
jgi:hypothetical protein